MTGFNLLKHMPLGAAIIAAPLFWLLVLKTQLFPQLPDFEPSSSWWLLKYMLLYPVLEEICFRGGVQGGLLRFWWGRSNYLGLSSANMITSTIFAVFHVLSQPVVWAMLIIIPSLVFGFMRDRYGNLGVPVVLHIFYNIGFWVVLA